MDLKEFEISANSFKDNPGIILRDDKDEMCSFTYRNIIEISEVLRTIFLNEFSRNSCIGLLMGHNLYIPSIILSILNVKSSFIFLKPDSLEMEQTIRDLGIRCIVSYNISNLENDLKYDINNYSQNFEVLKCTTHKFETKIKNQGSVYHQLYIHVINNNKEGCSNDSDINYIIKTSGTTGRTKYIKVYNQCIKANIDSLRSIFGITSSDLIYFGTPLTFDPSMVELYLALSSGACLLITSPDTRTDPKRLLDALFSPGQPEKQTTFIQTVPSVFLRWSQKEIDWILSRTKLRILALGGEPFPSKRIFENKNPSLNIFNLYGITEVSCWATSFNIDNVDSDLVPLGEPLSETFIKLVNEAGEDSNDGEICIGSFTRFCDILQDNPPSDSKELRKTGDIGYRSNGFLFYSGRKDFNIIKRNGQRLNLLEIENKIYEVTNIHSICLWITITTKEGSPSFLMTALLLNASEKSLDKIRIRLLTNLPPNSMPNHLFPVYPFPLTFNGKIDRRALEKIARALLCEKSDDDKDIILIFRSLWIKYLCANDFGIDENKNFYELGGDSVKRMELTNEFRERIGQGYLNIIQEDCSFLFFLNYKKICEQLRQFSEANKSKIVSGNEDVLKRRKKEDSIYSWKVSVKWKYDMLACVDSTATFQKLNDNTKYVTIGSFSHKLAILSAIDGKEIFSLMLPDAIENESSDFIHENNIFLGCFDAKLYCISLKNHAIKWSFNSGDRIKNKPCKFDDKDCLKIIFGSYDSYVYCLKARDGTLKWKTKLDGSIISSTCLGYDENEEPFVITITNKGTVIILDPRNGIIRRTYQLNVPVFGTPVFHEGNKENMSKLFVYGNVKGIVHVHFMRLNEENIIKTLKLDSGIYGSPAIIHQKIKESKRTVVISCENGTIYFLDVDSSKDILIENILQLETRISTTPYYDKTSHVLVVSANNGSVFVIDSERVKIVGLYKLPGECFSSPVVEDDCIYVGCRDNNLYCLEMKNIQLTKT